MTAIGLSGYGQSGKTTAANYIERVYGFKRVHIATTLRSMLHCLLYDLGYSVEDKDDILEGSRKDGWIIPELGVTSRHLQITIGTEWGRELINPDVWVKTWKYLASKHEKAMNDSVRFPNEEAGIKALGGFTILIERAGTGPIQFKGGKIRQRLGRLAYKLFGYRGFAHDSERTDRLNPTHVIQNDGTLLDLYVAIDRIMDLHGIHPRHPQLAHAPEIRYYTEEEVAYIRDQRRMGISLAKESVEQAGIKVDPRTDKLSQIKDYNADQDLSLSIIGLDLSSGPDATVQYSPSVPECSPVNESVACSTYDTGSSDFGGGSYTDSGAGSFSGSD